MIFESHDILIFVSHPDYLTSTMDSALRYSSEYCSFCVFNFRFL